MTKDTSGPAFPGQFDHGHTVESWTGMTMREYAAIKAMQGLLAANNAEKYCKQDISLIAVEQADALLKELAK